MDYTIKFTHILQHIRRLQSHDILPSLDVKHVACEFKAKHSEYKEALAYHIALLKKLIMLWQHEYDNTAAAVGAVLVAIGDSNKYTQSQITALVMRVSDMLDTLRLQESVKLGMMLAKQSHQLLRIKRILELLDACSSHLETTDVSTVLEILEELVLFSLEYSKAECNVKYGDDGIHNTKAGKDRRKLFQGAKEVVAFATIVIEHSMHAGYSFKEEDYNKYKSLCSRVKEVYELVGRSSRQIEKLIS